MHLKLALVSGEAVLKVIAKKMTELTRGEDFLVRFGVDELLTFVHCPDLATAVAYAQRVRQGVENLVSGGWPGRAAPACRRPGIHASAQARQAQAQAQQRTAQNHRNHPQLVAQQRQRRQRRQNQRKKINL